LRVLPAKAKILGIYVIFILLLMNYFI